MDNCPHDIEASGSEQEANLNVIKIGLAADHPAVWYYGNWSRGLRRWGKQPRRLLDYFWILVSEIMAPHLSFLRILPFVMKF